MIFHSKEVMLIQEEIEYPKYVEEVYVIPTHDETYSRLLANQEEIPAESTKTRLLCTICACTFAVLFIWVVWVIFK